MLKHDIKYKPLKDVDSEENQFRFHWSIKVIFVVFLLTQLVYVIYKSEHNYFNRNDTICSSDDRKDKGQAYDTQRIDAVKQVPTGRNCKEICCNSATPSHDPADNVNEEKVALNVNNIASAFTTTRPPQRQYGDHLTTTSAATSSVPESTNLIKLLNITFPGTTLAVTNNESTAAARTSTPFKEGIGDSTTSSRPIAYYSTETTVAPNVAAIGTIKQLNTTNINNPPVASNLNVTGHKTQPQQRNYFINTSRCHIPFIDPLTSEARKIFKPSHTTGCTRDKAIVSAGFDELAKQYILHTNYTVAMDFIKNASEETIADELLCCYRQIERSGSGGSADKEFKPIAYYSTETTVAPNVAAIGTIKQLNTTNINNPPVASNLNVTGHKTQPQQRNYFINTSRCHIPFIDPLTSEARKIFKPSHTTGCTRDKAIVSAGFDELAKQYILHTNYTVAMDFIKNASEETIADELLCCYRQIERSGSGGSADKEFKLLPCTNFHQDFVVPSRVNGVIVDCKSKSTGKLLQQDAFSFIQANPKYEQEIIRNASGTESAKGRRKFGILLIGMDSLSRMNFRRNMPETFKYLVDKGWYELKGYNKVGDNTFPNLLPLLAGYTGRTAYSKCNPKNTGALDNCNFIWKKFHEHGFATAYAEDTASISTFNYLKKGFKKPPTDYYHRPIALAIEKTMQKIKKAGLNYCVGRRQYGEYVYDYGLEFATRYRNLSHFGLFWTNSFSHSAYDTAATMDMTMLKYLEDIELRGILETSVIILFSDHGRRWGPLLKLPEGFLEERLPMFFISLPSWFKREYPSMVRNLEVNQRRLTTPFDIYMTMQQLLRMTAPAYNLTLAYDCPKAQSILQEIPEDRTCDQACIPETWCTCTPYTVQPTNSAVVKTVTQLILKEMNRYIDTRNITSLCSELTLHAIKRAKLRDVDVFSQSSQTSNISTYMIKFTTNPTTKPVTEFSATADYDAKRQRIALNVEDISRQSKYEDTAKCIDDKQAKKYCICKSL